MTASQITIGIIEGFYGKPWTWQDREDCLGFLQNHGFDFFIYAPKNDLILRENWQAEWPEDVFQSLTALSRSCKKKGIRFGIGLSPFEIDTTFDKHTKNSLQKKILHINLLQPDILCILFDDMKGDNPKLAETQTRIFDFSMAHSSAASHIVCPSYYSFDPILEKIFGKMPDNYLKDLGAMLDPSADLFWTGPMVFSEAYTESHLSAIAEVLKRKPFIWDNYPVNDAPSVAPFLRLRAFRNRPFQMSEWTAGHAINPMNEARLSQIPALSLMKSYTERDAYRPEPAFADCARTLCGQKLGDAIIEDNSLLQDKGLDQLSNEEKSNLELKYQAMPSPYTKEILGWLRGEYKR
jgi:hyaluronoglucosaminidase